MNNILVVDDEEPFRRLLKNELARKGYTVSVAADGGEALRLMRENPFDAILLDVVMPGVDGLSLMKKLKEDPSAPPIIVLTGKATVETAVEAMKNGAYDYLTKPYKLDELVIVVDRACEYGRLSVKSKLLEQELVRKESPFEFVGTSRQLKDILALIRKVAPTDSPVFIQGESGTGKELIANTVWHYSKRKETPFIALNCASLSESLIESEIFGHEKGAFTSAYQLKHGLVEVADTGTLFLDEIGEMPIGLQAKLLRFLDSGEFRRVGGNKALTVDVRLIAATNKDLAAMIKKGTFREDLYYRLNVINITLPPLRERKEDISALARHFLKQYAKKLDKSITDLTSDALELLA
jgi:two-component system response regulator AtoC